VTTILRKDKRCALCNQASKQVVIGSTNTMGQYPDLDTRPPEMMRSTMQWWVESCPTCGYCNFDISQMIKKANDVVKTEQYQKQLIDKKYPTLANAFLCQTMIHENNNEYREAGWACIHAAWACDDAGFKALSRECRIRALSFIEKMKELDQKFVSQPGVEDVIRVDLLRRSGQFESALNACREALKKGFDDTVSGILRFEMDLIGKRDLLGHTLSEINSAP